LELGKLEPIEAKSSSSAPVIDPLSTEAVLALGLPLGAGTCENLLPLCSDLKLLKNELFFKKNKYIFKELGVN
jgi:hypothetical protein